MRLQPADLVPARMRLLSLSEDVLVEVGPSGDHLVVSTQWGEARVDDTSPAVRDALQRMCLGPVSVENLPIVGASFLRWKAGAQDESCAPWYRFHSVLERLGSCVVQSLGVEDEVGPVLSVAPVSHRAGFWLPPEVAPDRPIRLSRFAAVRCERGGGLLMESPTAQFEVTLHRSVAAWVAGSLGDATTVAELASQLGVPGPLLADIVSYLVASGMVLTGERTGQGFTGRAGERPSERPSERFGKGAGEGGAQQPRFAEDGNPALIPWTHHDLSFHARSRMGRQGGQAGAVYPYADRLPAAPVTRPRPPGSRYALYRPVPAGLAAKDRPLAEVMEDRPSQRDRTDRDWATSPVTAEQLGELLFRAARIRWTKMVSSADGTARYVISDRPYLSTSDLYELELYLSLDRCQGLPRGSYHYDPGEHALTMVDDSEHRLAEILDAAKVATGSARRPAVLVTITTRIARLSWMYSGIAYSATLRHVGMLQQTLYLVATAMGLASSALTVGDGTMADEVLGLDWPTEVSVGEFVLGGLP